MFLPEKINSCYHSVHHLSINELNPIYSGPFDPVNHIILILVIRQKKRILFIQVANIEECSHIENDN